MKIVSTLVQFDIKVEIWTFSCCTRVIVGQVVDALFISIFQYFEPFQLAIPFQSSHSFHVKLIAEAGTSAGRPKSFKKVLHPLLFNSHACQFNVTISYACFGPGLFLCKPNRSKLKRRYMKEGTNQ
jgi:hypothetical protein